MKKLICVICLCLSLFIFIGCNTTEKRQELMELNKQIQEKTYNLEKFDKYEKEFEESMNKYKETNDKKYLDDAEYYLEKMKENTNLK